MPFLLSWTQRLLGAQRGRGVGCGWAACRCAAHAWIMQATQANCSLLVVPFSQPQSE